MELRIRRLDHRADLKLNRSEIDTLLEAMTNYTLKLEASAPFPEKETMIRFAGRICVTLAEASETLKRAPR